MHCTHYGANFAQNNVLNLKLFFFGVGREGGVPNIKTCTNLVAISSPLDHDTAICVAPGRIGFSRENWLSAVIEAILKRLELWDG